MVYSSPDMLALIAEVFTRRASMVCGKAAKALGMTLKQYLDIAPKYAQAGLLTVGALHHRYMAGDYRHDEKELLVIEVYCNWLVEVAHQAAGQTGKPVMFDPKLLESKERCRKKLYLECIAKVHTEW